MDATEETAGGGMDSPGAGRRLDSAARRPPLGWLVPSVVVASLAVAALVVGGLALARTTEARPAADHHVRVTLTAAQPNVLTAGATISVTGSGTVQGTPNEVSFTIGIHTTAASAAAALAANDGQIDTLEGTLAHHGVRPSGMQTSSLQLYDNTDSDGEITGFSVDDDLNVDMTDLSAAGAAIDAAAQTVGNGISLDGISFSISNQSALLAHARAEAMVNARTEAAQVAAGADLTLGPIAKVTDQENAPTAISYEYQGAAVASAANSLALEAGRQPVSVQVSVVYELSR